MADKIKVSPPVYGTDGRGGGGQNANAPQPPMIRR